jgi:hypothetical protein
VYGEYGCRWVFRALEVEDSVADEVESKYISIPGGKGVDVAYGNRNVVDRKTIYLSHVLA